MDRVTNKPAGRVNSDMERNTRFQGSDHELDIFPFYGRESRQPSNYLKRFLYKIIPAHTLLPFWAELRFAWIRLAGFMVRKKFRNAKNLWVNVGAGKQGMEGWVNIDAYDQPGVNCVYDCRKHLPFSANSVQGIFSEHFLEHLDYTEEVPMFLLECHRVLVPGGVLRIIVPDAEKYLKGYCQNGWKELMATRPLTEDREDFYFRCRYHAKMELVNVVFRQGGEHKYAYDLENLHYVLLKFGFSAVHRQSFGQSLVPRLCLDQSERRPESLYVEAVK